MEDKGKKIPVTYRRSEGYRILPVSGAVLGKGPISGAPVFNLYVEATPFPEKATLVINPDGTGKDDFPEREPTIVREVLIGLQIPPHLAISFGEFLIKHGSSIMEQQQKSLASQESAQSD